MTPNNLKVSGRRGIHARTDPAERFDEIRGYRVKLLVHPAGYLALAYRKNPDFGGQVFYVRCIAIASHGDESRPATRPSLPYVIPATRQHVLLGSQWGGDRMFYLVFALVRLMVYLMISMVKLAIWAMAATVALATAACAAISTASQNRRARHL
jgi:hypothetical protein